MIRVAMFSAMALLSSAASAQTIWSPKVDRATTVATLVHFPTSNVNAVSAAGPISVPASHFVSGLDFTPDGRLWATVQGPAGSMQQGLYSVNRITGAATQVGAPVGLAANEVITDLAWNPVTHRLTGMATLLSGGQTSRLLNFNINTGAVASAETLATSTVALHVGLTCQSSGQYLFLEVYNGWVSRDVNDDVIWLGNLLSFKPVYNQGFGTDFSTGTVWYSAYQIVNALQGTGKPTLRTVDPATGIDTLVANLPGGSSTIYTDAAVQPAEIHCAADLNADNVVEDLDFISFASQYNALECGTSGMTGGCSADFNFDGFVDDADFITFAAAYDVFVCS